MSHLDWHRGRYSPPTSVVFTDWLSMQAALGVGSRERRDAGLHSQRVDDLLPGAVVAPAGKVTVDRAPAAAGRAAASPTDSRCD